MLKGISKQLRKTPLAWLQVTREKTRLAVAIAGIAFADILMFFQLGLMESAYSAATGIHYTLKGDLFLLNRLSDNFGTIKPFSRSRLYQALGATEVDSVNYLYTASAKWQNPETRTFWQVQLYGVDPGNPAVEIPSAAAQLSEIKKFNYVMFDRAARPELGDVTGQLATNSFFPTQVNDLQVQVAGAFTLGASFTADGNLLMSDSTFLRLVNGRQPDQIDVGLIQLKPGADIEQAQAILRSLLPNDVLVLTKPEFIQRERAYWQQVSPIGVIFGFGTIVGFLVGTVIVYQILQADVSDHLAEYATLKAMGYNNTFLIGVLFQEALVLAVLGFIPGFAASLGLYSLVASATLLPVVMTVDRAAMVLSLTLAMCMASGAIASRKLQTADPADIF
ncbi:MAG TPA: FtsX-like permease family protein [Leptolyngbyaceae cyanobacterium M33_DOE_097]|uniref:FtsX-like permease family protein n=1 Tax=Oscillatoriales cyanobacterium SpSt-418 TaxID=2282169 RepID=A0A7C3PGQ0_9CYAN|nr:FtsX-like permease family protein [Leptolyngbyaceae cyanobacterium M33_DOE_097]